MRNTVLTLSQWETRVSDAFHMVELCRMTSRAMRDYVQSKINAELCRETKTRPVYSRYERGYVHGLIRARETRIQNAMVEFCYLKDGVLYSTHKQSTHRTTEEFYSSGRGAELANLPSGFYWKGTDKPFFGVDQ